MHEGSLSSRLWSAFGVLVFCCIKANAESHQERTHYVNVTVDYSGLQIVLALPEGDVQIFPPASLATNNCPNVAWQTWALHRAPPTYDPLHWTSAQWRDYIVHYPLRSAAFSLVLLVIALVAFIVMLTWRCVQWCVSCSGGRCCPRCRHNFSVGAEDTGFLGDTKHKYLKLWVYFLLAGAVAMVIWGMVGLNKDLLATFWGSVLDILDFGQAVSDSLATLGDQLSIEMPDQVTHGMANLSFALTPLVLDKSVQAAFNFSDSGQAMTDSLAANASASQAALQQVALPGLAALGSQLGITATRRARQLAQQTPGGGGSSPQQYDTLAQLLPAMRTSLPAVASAPQTRNDVQGGLTALQSASLQAQSITSPDSPAVAALDAALGGDPVAGWGAKLADMETGLLVYKASRSSPTFQAAEDAVDQVWNGTASLSPTAVQSLNAAVTVYFHQVIHMPSQLLPALTTDLANISLNVVDVSNWTLSLTNGTDAPIYNLSKITYAAVQGVLPYVNTSSSGAPSSLSVVQAMERSSASLAAINASLGALATACANASDAARAGPDPAPALTQLSSALIPGVATLAGPVASLQSALTAYKLNPSTDSLASLRAAAANVSAATAPLLAAMAAPLPGEAGLAATAQDLMGDVAVMGAASSDLAAGAGAVYQSLDVLSGGKLTDWQMALTNMSATIGVLPASASIQDEMQTRIDDVQSKANQVASDVTASADQAGTALNQTATTLQSSLLDPAESFVDTNREKTEQVADIVVPIWMAVWALGAFLLVMLAVSVVFNWPAGMVAWGLMLIGIIVVGQIVAFALAFGMAVLLDGCNNIEEVLMTEVAVYSNSPQNSVVLSYYLFGVPENRNDMIQTAFGINVTQVQSQIAAVNDTVAGAYEGTLLRATAPLFLLGLGAAGNLLYNLFGEILLLIRYEVINALYMDAKNSICCDAGTVAYMQWCATTAATCLAFAALVVVFYLLARMDMMEDRKRSCCSCCACVCYKSNISYKVGKKVEEEDQFAKEARKQQQLQQAALQQQHHNQLAAAVMGAGGAGTGPAVAATGPSPAASPSGRNSFATVFPVDYARLPSSGPAPAAEGRLQQASSAPPLPLQAPVRT